MLHVPAKGPEEFEEVGVPIERLAERAGLARVMAADTFQRQIEAITDLRVRASMLPEGAALTEPEGGFFCWLTLREGWTTDALLDAAIDQHVVFVPGASFCAPGEGVSELRLAYSLESPERLAEGTRRLGKAFERSVPDFTRST